MIQLGIIGVNPNLS